MATKHRIYALLLDIYLLNMFYCLKILVFFALSDGYIHVFDSIKLRMLWRANYVRLTCSQPQNSQYIHKLGWETGWAHSLLSLAFATRWNQKHPSYICICFLKFHLTALLWKADYMRCLKLLTS